jgi:hypothetical protein
MNPKAEEIRIRYLYRTLILRGQLQLPLQAAIPLVGPDCAYHLYAVSDSRSLPPGASNKANATDDAGGPVIEHQDRQ